MNRTLLTICLVVAALTGPVFGQQNTSQQEPVFQVVLSGPLPGSNREARAGLVPTNQPYATGGPWIAVPAAPLSADAPATISHVRLRAWTEGDAARVIVF